MAEAAQQALSELGTLLRERGRDDLAGRVQAAAARVARPATIVCVVGEFKQGKSLLVNALLGRPVCPVDDDLATAAITLVQHGSETSVFVVRRRDAGTERISIDPADVGSWVTEQGDAALRRGVERVVISLDHPLLARGLSIVDTPGVGGLSAGHGRATTAFLPYADALLFVTDASAELSGPELDFLAASAERCPTISVAVSKIDLFPEWRRIVELNARHLSSVAPQVRVFPVSAAAEITALRRNDGPLSVESGLPELRRSMVEDLLDRNRDRARARSAEEASRLLRHLIRATEEELEIVQNPDRIAAAHAAYEEAVRRLEQLKGPGSRWSQLMSDRMADLSSRSTFVFRGRMREITRRVDEDLEKLQTPQAWDDLAERLQADVAGLLGDLFGSLDAEASAVGAEIAELVADEAASDLSLLSAADAGAAMDVLSADLAPPTDDRTRVKRLAGNIVPALRGAQSGLMMFGLLGRFLPVGAAGLLMSNPITMVVGAAFAGQQVVSIRKRNLMQRRQQARVAVRSFLDDVQFETSHRLTESIRAHQRTLRDHFAGRVGELQRTYQELAERTRQEAADTYGRQAARAEQLRGDLDRFRSLLTVLAAAAGPAPEGGAG